MYISGLQKLTLLDYPEHLAATLFLDGCNFRCPFCHNSGLVLHGSRTDFDPDSLPAENDGRPLNDFYSEDEILEFLKKRVGMLDGICISGGEPTLHRDLPDLIARIKDLGYKVKLDTNGTNPDMLRRLLDDNLLDYIAMDIKAGRRNYAAAAGISRNMLLAADHRLLSKIQRSIDLIQNSGVDFEFRTTVVKGIHTEEDFEDIAQWFTEKNPESPDSASGLQNKRTQEHTQMSVSSGKLRYYLQSFRDCDTILLPNHSFSAFTEEEMLHFLSIIKKTIPDAFLRGMEP